MASWAAASSRARGMPSIRWQRSNTAWAFSSVTANPGSTSCARSANNLTASLDSRAPTVEFSGKVKLSSGNRISPGNWSGDRLVANTTTSGQFERIMETSRADSVMTCSQLSRIRRRFLSRMSSMTDSSVGSGVLG